MANNRVNPPKQVVLPPEVANNPQLKKAFDDRDFILFQLWRRVGGGDDFVGGSQDDIEQNTKDIETNRQNIAQNKEDIATNREDIDKNRVDIDLNRIDIDKNRVDIDKNTIDIKNNRESLREFDDLYEFDIDELIQDDFVSTSVDILTSGNQTVVCLDKLTVTLNNEPEDRELVKIHTQNGRVDINANGKKINKEDNAIIRRNFTTLDIVYLIEIDEWVII